MPETTASRALQSCAFLALFFLLCVRIALPQADEPSVRSEHFVLSGLDPDARWAKTLLEMAEDVWRLQSEDYPSAPPERIRLVWIDKSSEFHRLVPQQEFNTLAVASSGSPTIIFNGPRVNQQSSLDIRKTFVHEMAHLYINHNVPSEIPLWLNEGLAMHLARDPGREPTLFMALRNTLGLLPSLGELERGFPRGEQARLEAYTISYLAVARLQMRQPGGINGLLHALEQPYGGEAFFRDDVWRPLDREYRMTFLSGIHLFTLSVSSQVFWLLVTLLFIAAYIVKRRRSRIKRERLDDVVEEYIDYFDFIDEDDS
ncbi:hypothetical protein JXA32_09755 [Candidatus Sumerlaeota bacterium]|nr:hypothetical protein [Candidatus Sumerlaeota bacterium]